MRCPKCHKKMDMVINGVSSCIDTDYVCMVCEIKYTFKHQGEVELAYFEVDDLREEED